MEGAIDDLNKIRERANAKLYDASEYGGDLRYAIFKNGKKSCCWRDNAIMILFGMIMSEWN